MISNFAGILLIKQNFSVGWEDVLMERVATRFFERFQGEYERFLLCIEGITTQEDRAWYALVMLNRLMFMYFIQHRGFLNTKSYDKLDGNTKYLRSRLQLLQEQQEPGTIHTFYRSFLLRLFHEGFCIPQHQRTPELDSLLGKIPYLHGSLFDLHQLELDNPYIQIPDKVFERIFAFFDEFSWHLDECPDQADNEINPTVLGYVFEKYINQKKVGTYYTKEDITAYISKNTLLPYLFEAAKARYPSAFEPQAALWSLLRDSPDTYIYETVTKGMLLPLPSEIEAGRHDVAQRELWNKAAPANYALPMETWREVVARRTHYEKLRAMLSAGEITTSDDLITYNLNILAFTKDIIRNCAEPDLLIAFYESIADVRVLDPMCGSGAFLFAALNILEPIYEACLERMQQLVVAFDQRDTPPEPHEYSIYSTIERFQKTLQQVQRHPNRTYFILKSIIVNNLYGVDIMEEGIEICKLRLFLKLISCVTCYSEITPLPDLDFTICVGNTLIGFTTLAEVHNVVKNNRDEGPLWSSVGFTNATDICTEIERRAEKIGQDFRVFRRMQTELVVEPIIHSREKYSLHKQLDRLNATLNRYLATTYNIKQRSLNINSNNPELERWQKSHRPFHWCTQFYDIMRAGGFDVIIGNPPYVEYNARKVSYTLRNYETLPCFNLYPFTIERCSQLLSKQGYHGMIVPLAAFATRNMVPCIEGMQRWFAASWLSFYHFRPSMLFSGGTAANIPTTIYIVRPQGPSIRFSTHINKWTIEQRNTLFDTLAYCPITIPKDRDNPHYYPKFGTILENSIMNKVLQQQCIGDYVTTSVSENTMYYRTAGGLYWKVFRNDPWPYQVTSNRHCSFKAETDRDVFVAVLNSSLFWWYYTVTSDAFNLKDYMLFGFRFTYPQDETMVKDLKQLCDRLMADFLLHAEHRKRGNTDSYTVYVRYAKSIIDEIDRLLARHYGFTEEELDFIVNYDIKYRMGYVSSL